MLDELYLPSVHTRHIPGTDDVFEVSRDFAIALGTEAGNKILNIKAGFLTDFASVPRFFRRLIERQGRHSEAALAHDALYAGELLARERCDAIFLELLERYGVGWLQRKAMYAAVRLGGSFVWRRHTREGVGAVRKIVSLA